MTLVSTCNASPLLGMSGQWHKDPAGTLTNDIVVCGSNPTAVVNDFDAFETMVLEPHLWHRAQPRTQASQAQLSHAPMLVAPASKLFSTSSFTAVCRSMTTWPEVIRCAESASMALMERVSALAASLGVLGIRLQDLNPSE